MIQIFFSATQCFQTSAESFAVLELFINAAIKAACVDVTTLLIRLTDIKSDN